MDVIRHWAENAAAAMGLQPWVLIVFVVVLFALCLDYLQRRLMRRLGSLVEKTENLWDDAVFEAARRPLSLLIWLLGITLALHYIPAGEAGELLSDEATLILQRIGVLGAMTWFLVTFVKNIENNIIRIARKEGREIDETTVNALGRIIRITIVVTTVLVVLDTMGFSISGLMAAGGIGGLAVGFAAKDLLANFFGGLTVYIDRPFSVGDWILLQEKGIEGVVEHIGWRQTTIRKFDKRPVYVPNAIFTTASVENPSRMTHRRINEVIGLRYDDIGVMEAVTADVRKMLGEHPEIDQDQTLMVNFDAFAASSINFFIYCMTRTVNWQRYHEVKQDVLLKISRIVESHGAQVAFPTRTVKLESPGAEQENQDG